MKVAVLGANGQLGADLVRAFQAQDWEVVPLTREKLDVREKSQIASMLSAEKPNVVVNTTAFHKVEECEQNPQLSFEVNASAVMELARHCDRNGITFVHFSTDYVFDGGRRTPYTEQDVPRPLNVYGTSKLAGEHLVAYSCDRHFVIRTCGLYGVAGSSGKGGNFVETMLRKGRAKEAIRVVSDQVLTPTYTWDLAKMTVQLCSTEAYGLYHLSSDGWCSWYEFAKAIFETEGIDVDLSPVTTDQFPSPVKRPGYSVMSKEKIKSLGAIEVPHWTDALRRYLQVRVGR